MELSERDGVRTVSDLAVVALYRGVGKRVRLLRTRARMTQEQLADSLGVTRSSIANLEAGRQRSPLHLYVGIAQALGVSMTDLVEDAGATPDSLPRLPDEVSREMEVGDRESLEFVQRTLAALHGGEISR